MLGRGREVDLEEVGAGWSHWDCRKITVALSAQGLQALSRSWCISAAPPGLLESGSPGQTVLRTVEGCLKHKAK